MELHKYDVVEAQVNRGGSVQGKRRPYVIVSNEIGTRKSTIVTIVPLTSVIKGLHLPVHACIEACTENGLKKFSMILGEQPQTISKNDVLRKIGSVKDKEQRMTINKIVFANFFFGEEIIWEELLHDVERSGNHFGITG